MAALISFADDERKEQPIKRRPLIFILCRCEAELLVWGYFFFFFFLRLWCRVEAMSLSCFFSLAGLGLTIGALATPSWHTYEITVDDIAVGLRVGKRGLDSLFFLWFTTQISETAVGTWRTRRHPADADALAVPLAWSRRRTSILRPTESNKPHCPCVISAMKKWQCVCRMRSARHSHPYQIHGCTKKERLAEAAAFL